MEVALEILLWTGLCLIGAVEPNQNLLLKLHKQIGEATSFCYNRRIGTRDDEDLRQKLVNFWQPTANVTEEMGCVLECALQRLELLDEQDQPDLDNARGLLTASGADEATTAKVVHELSECTRKAQGGRGGAGAGAGCARVAKLTECGRSAVYNWHWVGAHGFGKA